MISISKELLVDALVVAFLGLIFGGALHIRANTCTAGGHTFSNTAQAHGRSGASGTP